MDRYDIESIRNANFKESRRGWDRREVEAYLDGLADWLESGAADEAGSYAVQKKLERAGQTTARVLATAEQEAETLRSEAQAEAKRMRDETRAEVTKTTETARAKAKRTVEEGEHRRKAIETVITDLVARRDAVVADIERLTRDLRDAAGKYRNAPFGGDDEKSSAADRSEATKPGRGKAPSRSSGAAPTEEQVEA